MTKRWCFGCVNLIQRRTGLPPQKYSLAVVVGFDTQRQATGLFISHTAGVFAFTFSPAVTIIDLVGIEADRHET